MDAIKNNDMIKKVGLNRILLLCLLVLMYFLFCVLSPTFLNYSRILSALNYAYFMGFLSLGVTFVIATGGIDFSIGPVMFCAALISGYLLQNNHVPIIWCIIIAILIGTMFGALNGYLVAYQRLPSFITSMASMLLAKGIGSVFTKTQSVSWPQSSQENGWFRNLVRLRIGGTVIPTGLLLLIIVAIICAVVLNKTKMGRYIVCLGSNREAVRLSGVNVKIWEMMGYIICGLMAGAAAILYVGAYTTVNPGLGDTFNNEAIAACVMGGGLLCQVELRQLVALLLV